MATHNLNNNFGNTRIIDKRQSATSDASPVTIATFTATQSTATLDAALAALDGARWTQAALDATCFNDKLYAWRLSSDSAGV